MNFRPTSPVLLLALVGCSGSTATTAPAPRPVKPPVEPVSVDGTFTVGKDTTYVTGPLDAAGRVDYVAALNDRLKRGVTPETNAAVLLWKAIGPPPDGPPLPAAHFELLGISPPPENGDYFVPFSRYENNDPNPAARLTEPSSGPWTAEQYPDVVAWLAANEKPLAVVIEATKRPHFFFPLVPDPFATGRKSLFDARLPLAQTSRLVAQALIVRAMFRLGRGEREAVWGDLIACHRLVRHIGNGATLIEGLVGCALDMVTFHADIVFLDKAGLSAADIERCEKDIRALAPLPDVAARLDQLDRLTLLDTFMQIDRYGVVAVTGFEKSDGPQLIPVLVGIDWDPALRTVNKWYDQAVVALREPTHAARQRAWTELEVDLLALAGRVGTEEYRQEFQSAPDPAQAKGRAMGEIFITKLFPAVTKVQDAAERARQYQDNMLVALALARCKLDSGRYPAKLDSLVPRYLPTIPPDRFSGKPLVYRPTENGYLLYSVGLNANDEDGRGHAADPPGDDIEVRIPARP